MYGVVYFDKHLVAAYPKRWSKSSCSVFFVQEAEKTQKSNKFGAKFSKKMFFLIKLAPKRRLSVLFPDLADIPLVSFSQSFMRQKLNKIISNSKQVTLPEVAEAQLKRELTNSCRNAQEGM